MTETPGNKVLLKKMHPFNDRDAGSRLDRHMTEERVERPQYAERAAGDLTQGFVKVVSGV